MLGAIWLSKNVEAINYSIQDAGAIGIIGEQTVQPLSSSPESSLPTCLELLLWQLHMALVPIIQPPIMKLLTTEEERKIGMKQLRHVSKAEKIVFPVMVLVLCGLLLPSATPLVGMLMLGNLFANAVSWNVSPKLLPTN